MNTFNIRPYQMEDIDAVYAAADESRVIISKWMGWKTPEYSRENTAMGAGKRWQHGTGRKFTNTPSSARQTGRLWELAGSIW